jgi:hypothetical protein
VNELEWFRQPIPTKGDFVGAVSEFSIGEAMKNLTAGEADSTRGTSSQPTPPTPLQGAELSSKSLPNTLSVWAGWPVPRGREKP